jgi:putative membrane protein
MTFGRFPGDYGGPFWIHDLFLLIIVVVVILGIYFLVRGVPHRPPWPGPGPRQYWGRPPGRGPRNPAIDELDLRYARGELDRVEYMQRRADLLGAPPPDDPGTAPGASPQP